MHPVLVSADEAVLFMTDMAGEAALHERALDEALARMSVTAARRRVVALADQPELGVRWQVRVTPCLVLGIGPRLIHLSGEPTQLGPPQLEQALAKR